VASFALPSSVGHRRVEDSPPTGRGIKAGQRTDRVSGTYTLDDALIRRIDPDLILTQDLCRVCAVPSGAVQDALEMIGCHVEVVSLDPHRLDDVIAGIGVVGAVTGTSDRAQALMTTLRERVEATRRRVDHLEWPKVFVLEWADPPFNAGHWVLAEPGERSRRLTWDEIAAETRLSRRP
jgi:iron complex transport system substrate-binding protein